MFGMFISPFAFIFPLIIFFVISRVLFGFFRGISRRNRDELPGDFHVPPEVASQARSRLTRRSGSLEAQLFKLAYRLKGRVTLSDIVIETGLSLTEAEALVEGMVDNSHVRMEVDDRGMVVYEFPEILRRFEEEE